jgi:hypothetical protein
MNGTMLKNNWQQLSRFSCQKGQIRIRPGQKSSGSDRIRIHQTGLRTARNVERKFKIGHVHDLLVFAKLSNTQVTEKGKMKRGGRDGGHSGYVSGVGEKEHEFFTIFI